MMSGSNEIQEDMEAGGAHTTLQITDYLPVNASKSEMNLSSRTLASFLYIQKTVSSEDEVNVPGSSSQDGRRHQFCFPFARKLKWKVFVRYLKDWLRKPANAPIIIWFISVMVCFAALFLLMTGLLNYAMPSKFERDRWTEIITQILNALFIIMCLYEHPMLIYHLVLLVRWKISDRVELRKVYCKDGATRNQERVHIMLVVVLFNITCFAQYVVSGIYWGYRKDSRPLLAVILCNAIGTLAPSCAVMYIIFSVLGRKFDQSETTELSDNQTPVTLQAEHSELNLRSRKELVTDSDWIGGLFDCCNDRKVFCLSFFCTFCTLGWNLHRLGLGNMYVRIVTSMLLCVAPLCVFEILALNIDEKIVQDIIQITGILLSFFGLFYGGFWRTEMRKRFKLPPNNFCFSYPLVTDLMQWLFCWSCSLAQEVRTANFYDIVNGKFYTKVTDNEDDRMSHSLQKKGGSGLSYSSSIDNDNRNCICKVQSVCGDHTDNGHDTTLCAGDTKKPPIVQVIQV